MAITPAQWAAEGAIPGMNRQQEHASQMMTAELQRTETTANIYGKIVDNEEKRYKLAEHKTRKGQRDVESLTAIEKAKNAGYKFASDTDQNKMMESVNQAKVASETGDQGAWDSSVQLMSAAHPVYAKMLKAAKTPRERRQLLESIAEGIGRSLEVAQKGVLIGMQGDEAKQLLADRQAGDSSLQKEKFDAMVEAAQTDRDWKSNESDKQRTHEEGMGAWKTAGTASIKGYGEETGDWEGAAAMYEALHKSQIAKNERANRTGGRSKLQQDKDKIQMSEDILGQVGMRAISTASGGDLEAISDPTELNKIPGAAEMAKYIDELLDKNMGGSAARMAADRYLYIDSDRGFVGLPTDDNGNVLGGKTALEIAAVARAKGWKVEEVLRAHRKNLISKDVIKDDDWNF